MKTNNLMESLTFTVPLSIKTHQKADEFRHKQLDTKHAKQVYLNTLSVYAVEFYLKCMGFEPDWKSSESFDPMMQKFSDVADLNVQHLGKFECRPVLPSQQIVSIPLESMNHRRGYFAVQLNKALTEANILGFIKQVSTEEVPLNQLKSLDFFLKYASQIENAVKLNQWLQNTFETGWETLETLLSPPKMAWRSRNVVSDSLTPINSDLGVERIKKFHLEPTGEQVGLLVRLQPRTELEMGIEVELYPTNHQVYLPQNLLLMLLDEDGETVMQAEARSTKNIQLKFSGESGEIFSVKVALGDLSVVETFVI
ncbi:DUF1822 family protein [Limnoraphis robusta Tam1]|uniref:DUF1822 family protein n=1 Tax=Limnoraphis robusta TaxID=1118279 RepID=UPI002B21233B|nr:DUF1822 family protein [Limnoraphis robusta]MEA5538345.1 DUF1822 family protein [Limnoraphis robusta Tam1]